MTSLRRKPLAAVLTMSVAAIIAGQATPAPLPRDPNSRFQVEAYIRACEGEWAHTEVTGDASPIGMFLAQDYEGVSSQSVVVNKAKAMEPFAPDKNVVSDNVDYVRIRFPSADVAIAQGAETATLKNGTRKSLIWTDTWMLRNGRWQIVTSQDSRLPKPYLRPRP